MNLSQFNRILSQTLLLPVLALSVVASILVWQIRNAEKTVTSIQAIGETITAAATAEKLIVDQETGLRGYQITSDRQFLDPYNNAESSLPPVFDLLRRNLRAHKDDERLVDAIANDQRKWRDTYAELMIAATDAGGDTRDLALNLRGKQQMDTLRQHIAELLSHEEEIRARQVDRWRQQAHHTIEALILLVLAAGVLIGIFAHRQLHRVSDAYRGMLDGLRRHAQATFDSEERLRTTLTSIGDGVVVCDPDGRVELLNTVAQELTGWSQNDAFHRPLEEVFHIVNETSRKLVETPVARVKRLKRVVGLANHTILIRRDGTELNIDDSGAPIYDRSGALSGIVMVFRDITTERKAQSALLATEKLAVAGRLAATIAHELHNPLDSVSNLLYLMKDETDPATSTHYLTLAQKEIERMGQVSRAMLGLYREAKNPVPIDVKEMIESVLVLLDLPLRKGQIALDADLPAGLIVEGFPAELRQVFTNLIANAAEAASPSGAISIRARRSFSKPFSTPGVTIQVIDNGTGIPTTALEHLFEPFFTTKGEMGTGLGLWFSRGIVDKHGGTIDIGSHTGDEDHGTTITVFLPATGPAAPRA